MSRFNKITVEEAKKIANAKNLKPATVKGTNVVQLTDGKQRRFEIISWEDFEARLNKRGLALYEYNGWMKIMKK